MVLISARKTVPSSIIQAARLLGDRWPEVFLNIRAPLMVPGLLTAAVLCFSMSIGEMGATMMVAPAEMTTMPLALYRFISGGRDFGAASAYAVIMLFVTLGSFLVVHWVVGALRNMGVGRSD
jgi:thiamine transport system permease protein